MFIKASGIENFLPTDGASSSGLVFTLVMQMVSLALPLLMITLIMAGLMQMIRGQFMVGIRYCSFAVMLPSMIAITLWAVSASFRTTISTLAGTSELHSSSEKSLSPPDVDWSTVLVVVSCVVAAVAVVWIAGVLYEYHTERRAAELTFIKQLQVAHMQQALINEQHNRQEVQGLAYAIRNERVTTHDLRSLTTEELQRKVDADNMHSAQIHEVLSMLPYYDGCTSRRDKKRQRELNVLLREMREQPEEVQRKALAGHADRVIMTAREAVQSVRELEEG